MAVSRETLTSSAAFIGGLLLFILPDVLGFFVNIFYKFVFCLLLSLASWYALSDCGYAGVRQIALRAFFLGVGFGLGVVTAHSNWSFRLCGWYIATLSFFHWSEYFFTAVTNPQNLNLESFLLKHSLEYHLAIAASFIEFALEWIFFPSLTEPNFLSIVGLLTVCFGELLRKGAMWNAGTNFNHHIRNRREQGHNLITSGLYAYCRHPSYVGWFLWSVGTQVMICNPICSILYAMFSWYFFRERIRSEEYTLIRFFGEQYVNYQKRVPSGLPFIYGFNVQQLQQQQQ